jgi:carbon monoxide dehydrogenase subunit G
VAFLCAGHAPVQRKESSVRIAGNYTFEATREEVWSAINDPEVLARTIPGCQRLDQVGEHEFDSTLKIGLQAVRGVYSGRMRIENHQAPVSYELDIDGKGSNGFLKGHGSVTLREEGAQTILDYGGEAHVGGTIASVGQRLLDGAARTLISQSLKALDAQIKARREGASEAQATDSTEAPEQPSRAPTPPSHPHPQSSIEAGALVDATTPEVEPEPIRRTITVPKSEQLSEAAVTRGIINDLIAERPWLPWVVVAFLIGYILGRRK